MSFRSMRTSYFHPGRNGEAYSRATGDEPLADKDIHGAMMRAGDADPLVRQLSRSAMHGVLVMGVMSAVNGQAILSQEVITAGIFAGVGVWAIDAIAPSWSEAARWGIARA